MSLLKCLNGRVQWHSCYGNLYGSAYILGILFYYQYSVYKFVGCVLVFEHEFKIYCRKAVVLWIHRNINTTGIWLIFFEINNFNSHNFQFNFKRFLSVTSTSHVFFYHIVENLVLEYL